MTNPKFSPAAGFVSIQDLGLSPTQVRVRDLKVESVATCFGSPGAGKTTALSARFLSLLASGLTADQLVVISATRQSANQLRDQLALEVQGATTGPIAKTLTSLAFSILANRAKKLGLSAPLLISGSEQDQILKEILENQDGNSWPKNIDKAVRSLTGFRTELRDLLAVCLEHGIGPAELREYGSSNNQPAWIAAAEVLTSYVLVLEQTSRSAFDSASLLRKAANYLSELTELPTELLDTKVILVDDAQELTPAAAKLLFELTRFGAGITLFGDPDVATLGFRAADPKSMANLAEAIARARSSIPESIFLEPLHALRRPQISAALARVSAQIEVARAGRQRRGLNPSAQLVQTDDSTQLKVFRSVSDELAYVAGELRKRHLFDQVPWSRMAVVSRSRPALEALALQLSAESVPVRVIGTSSSLRDEHASGELLRIARYCLSDLELDAEQVVGILVSEFAGLDQLALLRLKRSLRKLTQDFDSSAEELIVGAFANPNSLSLIRTQEARAAEKAIRLLHETAKLAKQPDVTAEAILWNLLEGSGVMKGWIELARGTSEVAIQANRNLDAMLALFGAAARFTERNPETNPAVFIQDQLEREIPEDSLSLNNQSGEEVLLLTPAGLIGRRFDTVVLPGLIEGVWPNLKPRSSLLGANVLDAMIAGEISQISEMNSSELAGELRMLNKAIGAATEKLLITATDKEQEQLSQFFPLILGSYPEPEIRVSKTYTLRSLVGSLRRDLASGQGNDQTALGLARLASAGISGADPASWYGLLPLSTEEPLTDLANETLAIRPSQLDNYLKCPLHWFIQTHGGSADSFSASLGSLIHEVLEVTNSSDIDQLTKLTNSRWNSLEFEADWLEDLGRRQANRMLSNLASYLKQFEEKGGKVLAKEQNFSFELGSVLVRGQVDRIEQLENGNVVIVDLKTSKQSPAALEVATNPQLALYQMAVLESGFENLGSITPEQLAGAKLLIVGGSKYLERMQPAMDQTGSDRFKKLLLDASEGMSKPVFIAEVSSHCQSDREYGSCSLQLTQAVSYVG